MMSFFSYRYPFAAAAGLTLLAGAVPAAWAQGSPPPPAPAAKVDPQAKVILDQMVTAYQALDTYSAKIAVESTAENATQKQTVTVSFQRPNRARVVVADATGPLAKIVSDGVSMFILSPHDNQYVKQPTPAQDAIPAVLSQARGSLLPTLAGNPKFLSRLFALPGVTVKVGAPETIGAVPTDTVTTILPGHGGVQNQISLSISTEDHLLRRLTETARFTQAGKTKTFTHTETVLEQTPNAVLTAADFAFVPPPGAKKVSPEAMQPPMYDPRLKPGAYPFPIAAKDLSGRPLTLAQYKGKVVLMDFWATWCGPCVGEMPNVIAAYKKFHAQGFDVVGISLDQDKGALLSFLKQNKMPWRQIYDGKYWSSAVPRQYGVMAIPFGLLLNRDGTIAAVEARGPALPTAIQVALAKK